MKRSPTTRITVLGFAAGPGVANKEVIPVRPWTTAHQRKGFWAAFGQDMVSVGDWDGDGTDDLLVDAPGAGPGRDDLCWERFPDTGKSVVNACPSCASIGRKSSQAISGRQEERKAGIPIRHIASSRVRRMPPFLHSSLPAFLRWPRMPPPMDMPKRATLTLFVVLAGCVSGKPPDNLICPPKEPYSPQREPMDTGAACEGDSGSPRCFFDCTDATFCSGTVGATYCELCSDLDTYAAGPCADCIEESYGNSVFYFTCPVFL